MIWASGVARAEDPRPRVAVAGIAMGEGSDARDGWMATAVEEVLSWRLRRSGELIVIPTARIHQTLRDVSAGGGKGMELSELTRLLGATQRVSGTCRPAASSIALELRVTGAGGEEIARSSVEGRSIFEVIDAGTKWLVSHYRLESLPDGARKLMEAPPSASPSALEYYAKAVMAARAENLKDVSYYVTEALTYDRHFREAVLMHARLAMHGGPASYLEATAKFRLLNEIARHFNDALDRSNAELGHGTLAMYSKRDETAMSRFESALSIAAEANDPYAQLAAIGHLCDTLTAIQPPRDASEAARAAAIRSNLSLAAEWQGQVLMMLEELGDVLAEGPAASKLALILERLERWDEALAMHRRSLAASERTGLIAGQASAWMLMAQHYSKRRMWTEALDAATRCMGLTPATGQAPIRVMLAGIYQSMKMPTEALAQYDVVLSEVRKGENLADQLACVREVAALQMELGKRKEAIASMQEAVDLAHALRSPEREALAAKLAEWKKAGP